jgi:catabolite repression protein CreC
MATSFGSVRSSSGSSFRCRRVADLSLCVDPLTAKYTRLNKMGIIASSPITSVAWLPPSPANAHNENHSNLFLTSHADGTMLVWDKDREDWSGFTPTSVPTGINLHNPSLGGAGKENDWASSTNESSYPGSDSKHAPMSTASLPAGMSDLMVSRPPNVDKKGGATTKFNPVSHWRVSKKAITGE